MPKIGKREDLLFGTINANNPDSVFYVTGMQTREAPCIWVWFNETDSRFLPYGEAVRLANAILNYKVEPIQPRKKKVVKRFELVRKEVPNA